MSKSHLKIFICGSAVSLLGTVLLGIVNYLTRRFLCCSLSIADYGTFYSAFALLAMVFGICDLGLTQSGTMLIAAAGLSQSQIANPKPVFFYSKAAADCCVLRA